MSAAYARVLAGHSQRQTTEGASMTTYLQIGGDPTMWLPAEPVDLSQLREGPVPVPIIAPLFGTLLISSRAASIALVDPGDKGPVPSDAIVLVESLYVPTATRASQSFTGYQLAPGTNLADLQTQITALMRKGTSQAIPLGGGTLTGEVVLNGATLPFVVLAPVHETSILGDPSGGGPVPSD
jgi:hypothetical protein